MVKLFLTYSALKKGFSSAKQGESLIFVKLPPKVTRDSVMEELGIADSNAAWIEEGGDPLTFQDLDIFFEQNGIKPLGAIGHCCPPTIAQAMLEANMCEIEALF